MQIKILKYDSSLIMTNVPKFYNTYSQDGYSGRTTSLTLCCGSVDWYTFVKDKQHVLKL